MRGGLGHISVFYWLAAWMNGIYSLTELDKSGSVTWYLRLTHGMVGSVNGPALRATLHADTSWSPTVSRTCAVVDLKKKYSPTKN
eukprot:3366316-Amphidinium_carterae.1